MHIIIKSRKDRIVDWQIAIARVVGNQVNFGCSHSNPFKFPREYNHGHNLSGQVGLGLLPIPLGSLS